MIRASFVRRAVVLQHSAVFKLRTRLAKDVLNPQDYVMITLYLFPLCFPASTFSHLINDNNNNYWILIPFRFVTVIKKEGKRTNSYWNNYETIIEEKF